MKKLILLLAVTCLAGVSQAAELHEESEKEHAAPYFLVEGDKDVDGFPLLKTEVRTIIAGMASENELIQVYKNNGEKTIEALYVFPLGTKSAVHSMTMKIGERIIKAQIEKTEKAQEIYENAKNNGQTASLLEQKRPNVFQMKVANILPGDVVEVITQYTEILVSENGIYEFVFPAVVGPRFTGESDVQDLKNKDNWLTTPYLSEGKKAPYDFNMRVCLKTGIPISKLWSPSHKIDIHKQSKYEKLVSLSSRETSGGNRDFILRYSLQGNAIQTGILLYPEEKEKYFLLLLEPPEQITMDMIPPREYVFIVDVSGSMHGFPLEISKTVITNILQNLRKKDYFNILFFSGSSDVLSEYPLPATQKNINKAVIMLESQQGSGGTQILNALQQVSKLGKEEGLSRIIVTATDGYVSVEKETFDFIRKNLCKSNFFAFGIGSSVNRYIIEGMARAGSGEPFIALNEKEGKIQAEKFLSYIQHPVLTDIKIKYQGFDAYDIEPISQPDLFARKPLIVYGKYTHAKGEITVTGRTAQGIYAHNIDISSQLENKGNIAIKYLWAREKIARLSDYGKVGQDIKEEVTKLGLTYHLMTEYTSFVAVDSIKRNSGEVVTVKQPLPLPEGVSNLAVGACVSKSIMTQRHSFKPFNVNDKCESKEIEVRKKNVEKSPRFYITSGKVPIGITLYEIETVVLKKIEKDLQKVFTQWNLSRLYVVLEVKKGNVVSMRIKQYTGDACQVDVLQKIIQKMSLDRAINGIIEINLVYQP